MVYWGEVYLYSCLLSFNLYTMKYFWMVWPTDLIPIFTKYKYSTAIAINIYYRSCIMYCIGLSSIYYKPTSLMMLYTKSINKPKGNICFPKIWWHVTFDVFIHYNAFINLNYRGQKTRLFNLYLTLILIIISKNAYSNK